MQSYAKSLATILLRGSKDFVMKFILLKKLIKIADLSFCFEFQVVVVVVGFKWHS